MKNIVLLVFCFAAVFLQLSAEGSFFADSRLPDLSLALIVVFVMAIGFEKTAGWIILTGFFIDAGSAPLFGTTALAFFLIALAVSAIATVADVRTSKILFLFSLALIAAFAEILKTLIIWGSLAAEAYFSANTVIVFPNILSLDYALRIFYTILATYALYYIFRKVSRLLLIEPVKLASRFRY